MAGSRRAATKSAQRYLHFYTGKFTISGATAHRLGGLRFNHQGQRK
jgi:hypothetical protein